MKTIRTGLAIFLLLACTGCSLPFFGSTPPAADYHPIIKDLSVYPGMKSRADFYNDLSEFWIKAKDTKPSADELLNKIMDIDTVLEAREAQIEAYNKWAAEHNTKNGYDFQQF